MALEARRVNRPGAQSRFQILAEMEPLSAGCDFKTLEQEIETAGRTGRSPWSRIKGPGRQREAEDKYRGNAGLSHGSFAKLPLRLGIQVVFQVSASKLGAQHFQACIELPTGDTEHGRKQIRSILLDHVAILPV